MEYNCYEIEVPNEDGKKASEFEHEDQHVYLPYMITSNNENMYLVIHGNPNSKFSINNEEYTLEEIKNFYTGMAKLFNYDTINIICCYGYYFDNIFSNIGVDIRIAFQSKQPIYTEFKDGKMHIYVEDDIEIDEYYKDEIKYIGKKEYIQIPV